MTICSSIPRSAGPASPASSCRPGGPSPPLAVPGIRVKAELSDRITAYLALFDGSASPPDAPLDPQLANPHGVLFRVNDPPWWIGQLKYKFEIGESQLPATITGGAWYHMMSFADQRFGADGLSLADPNSSGDPLWLRRNNGVFMVYEQMLQRSPFDKDKGVAFFMRASVSPSDRNLISAYVDGGFLFTGFSEARPNDRFGVAATYARISDRARAFDQDVQLFTGVADRSATTRRSWRSPTARRSRRTSCCSRCSNISPIPPAARSIPTIRPRPAASRTPSCSASGRRLRIRPARRLRLASGGREIVIISSAATMQSAPATKNAGR